MSGAIRRPTRKNVLNPTKRKPLSSPEKVNSRVTKSLKSPVKEAPHTSNSASSNKENGKNVDYKSTRDSSNRHFIGEHRFFLNFALKCQI